MNFRFDRYIQNLDIADNYIASLEKTSLRELGLISLVQLNAPRRNIYDVEEEAFLEQTNLHTMDFSSNSLVVIEFMGYIPKAESRNTHCCICVISTIMFLCI